MKKRMIAAIFMAVMVLCAFGRVEADAAELTNVTFGKDYNGGLANGSEYDWYKITVPSAGTVTFNGYSSDLTRLIFQLCTETKLEFEYQVFRQKYSQDAIGRISANETVDLAKGTYYLAVSTEVGPGNYLLNIRYEQKQETMPEGDGGTNNTIDQADSIVCGTNYIGFIAKNDRTDCYKFTVGNTEKVKIYAYTQLSTTQVELVDYAGNVLWYDNTQSKNIDGGGNRVIDSINGDRKYDKELAPGTYFVRVSNYSHTGNYAFRLEYIHRYSIDRMPATPTADGAIQQKCACGDISGSTPIYAPSKITLSKTSYTYDGKVKKPSVTVKDSAGNKIAASNYSVSYAKDRKKVGTYKVTITFKGSNYSGKVTKTFTIKPKGTSISSITAGKKRITVRWKAQKTQTTGYEIQYSTSKKFQTKTTKSVTKNSKTSATYNKLKSKKTYYVRIRTYKKVSGKKIYSSWSKAKTVKVK